MARRQADRAGGPADLSPEAGSQPVGAHPSRKLSHLYIILRGLGFNGPPMTNDGLKAVMAAERECLLSYMEAKAAKLASHGGRASARQLRIMASEIRAGLHEYDCEPIHDEPSSPEGTQ